MYIRYTILISGPPPLSSSLSTSSTGGIIICVDVIGQGRCVSLLLTVTATYQMHLTETGTHHRTDGRHPRLISHWKGCAMWQACAELTNRIWRSSVTVSDYIFTQNNQPEIILIVRKQQDDDMFHLTSFFPSMPSWTIINNKKTTLHSSLLRYPV